MDFHYNDSLDLDAPLGPWLPVLRNTWFPVYRTHNQLFWHVKDSSELYILDKSPTSGFYHHTTTTTQLPLESHPITYQQIGNDLWTQKPYRIAPLNEVRDLPARHLVSNTLSSPDTEILTIGSDGSVYIDQEVAACAWVIATDESSAISACFLLTNISSVSSYRSELEGIYRSLLHIQQLGITPMEIQMWFNNESAVSNSNSVISSPSKMTQPDADILLAIHHLRSEMERRCKIHCSHIYGHQDTRRRRSPVVLEASTDALSDSASTATATVESHGTWSVSPPSSPALTPTNLTDRNERVGVTSKPSLPVLLNIKSDKLASSTTSIALGPHRTDLEAFAPPYPGSRAMLKIGHTWITSKIKHHILRPRWSPSIIQYCMLKYNWDQRVFDAVAWKQLGNARRHCTPTQRMQTSKIMHGWLPVMHMQSHTSGSARCPLCPCLDETMDHLFQCPHPVLKCKRELILEELRKNGLKLGIPRVIVEALSGLLHEYFTGDEFSSHTDALLLLAVQDQRDIGLHMIPRGFLASSWIDAMEGMGCPHPHRKLLTSLIHFLWMDGTDMLWRERNHLAHESGNFNEQGCSDSLNLRVQWYMENYRGAISHYDYHLISDIHSDDLAQITLRTKRQLLLHLDAAKAAYTESSLRLQPRITKYFSRLVLNGT